jgi:hypothetical protein
VAPIVLERFGAWMATFDGQSPSYLAACRTEVYSMISNDGLAARTFIGARSGPERVVAFPVGLGFSRLDCF